MNLYLLIKRTLFLVVIAGQLIVFTSPAFSFDPDHKIWDDLLKTHVKWNSERVASQVDYGGFKTDQMPFKAYLNDLSSVTKNEFDSWSRNRRLAFLINAYNAYTIELILTRYPGLSSIKDLGSFLSSPWKKKFFTLFGKETSLDGIEHDMIRARGEYDEPRIHFSVVCASIGCPGIRNSAYTEVNLEAYLEDSMKRFLSDPTRNRYNPQSGKLEVSMIFKWYGKDFSTGGDGYQSLKGLFAKYAHLLTNAVEITVI